MPAETVFQIVVGVVGSLAFSLCALAYFRVVRLERPAIGTFNGRDLVVLAIFIVALPVPYLLVAPAVLTGFLVVTFLAGLMIALRPLLPARRLWVAIPALLAANIVVTDHMTTLPGGPQVYWLLTSVIVGGAAVGVANLYVQGGLHLRQIACFTLFLAVTDIVFTRVIPLTPKLAVALQGRPLDPSIGFASGRFNANVGLGDLLIFCLYTAAAYKGFGRRGAVTALFIIAVFGAVAPSVTPLLVPGLFGTTAAAFVPIQTLFGPAAFVGYLWLKRTSPERTTAQWLSEKPTLPTRPPRPARAEARPLARALAPGLAVAGLAIAFVTGTGDTSSSAATTAPTSAGAPGRGPVLVAMRDVAFGPHDVTVKLGKTVHWRNADRVPHDAVATSGADFRSRRLSEGQTFAFRPTAPGRVTYVCTVHQGMTGTLIVER
jgi:plastocyanin